MSGENPKKTKICEKNTIPTVAFPYYSLTLLNSFLNETKVKFLVYFTVLLFIYIYLHTSICTHLELGKRQENKNNYAVRIEIEKHSHTHKHKGYSRYPSTC